MNLEKIEQDLPKYSLHFNKETVKWWRSFLKRQRLRGAVTNNKEWRLDALTQTSTPTAVSEEAVAAAEKLKQLYAKERKEAEVS